MPKYDNYEYNCRCGDGFHTEQALIHHKDEEEHW